MELTSCRICSTSEKMKLLSLFSVRIDDKTLAEMVNFLSGIEIRQSDNLPEMICIECLSQVTSACETKAKCIEADKMLRNLIPPGSENQEIVISSFEAQPISFIVEVVEENADVTLEESVENKVLESKNKACRRKIQKPCSTSNKNNGTGKGSSESVETAGGMTSEKNVQESNNFPACKSENTDEPQPEYPCKNLELDQNSFDLKFFHCDLCAFSSKRKKNVERHILGVHLKSYKFKCAFEDCSREYTTQAALKLHCVRDHDEKSPFQCEKCNQKFSCESLFRIHKQRLICRPRKNRATKKVPEKTLPCPHCDFKTAHQFSLNQHINLIHLNIRKIWKCSICVQVEFSNRISLNQHMITVHNSQPIRCSECNQAFSSDAQLKAHKESLKCNARAATEDDYEETESGIKCNLCSRNYRSKKEWITHYFNHHKFKKVCDICNVQLSTYASLKNHKKTIHEKVKPFACSECPKKFSAKHTLEFHLNTHSGIKPYSCKWCSFKASDRSSISKHQRKIHPEKA